MLFLDEDQAKNCRVIDRRTVCRNDFGIGISSLEGNLGWAEGPVLPKTGCSVFHVAIMGDWHVSSTYVGLCVWEDEVGSVACGWGLIVGGSQLWRCKRHVEAVAAADRYRGDRYRPPEGYPNGHGRQLGRCLGRKASHAPGTTVQIVWDADAGSLAFGYGCEGPVTLALDSFPHDAQLRPWISLNNRTHRGDEDVSLSVVWCGWYDQHMSTITDGCRKCATRSCSCEQCTSVLRYRHAQNWSYL